MTLYTTLLASSHSLSRAVAGKESRRTISSVQTRRIHTFSTPSTPSTFFSSTPSHQHLRAGLRQNNSSFCAMPTTLLLVESPLDVAPLMSVRSRASASEQMTALLGSDARWPQVSAWLNPLIHSPCQ